MKSIRPVPDLIRPKRLPKRIRLDANPVDKVTIPRFIILEFFEPLAEHFYAIQPGAQVKDIEFQHKRLPFYRCDTASGNIEVIE